MSLTIPQETPTVPEYLTVKRALISVSDKTDLIPFAQRLHERGIEILSTGGTARMLKEAGFPVIPVEELTGFPEMLDGRVKTLHPVIHGAILARTSDPDHLQQLHRHSIEPIQLVVVNLYPFEEQMTRPDATEEEMIEFIDIGGPTLIRAAAKNFYHVAVVSSPEDYSRVLEDFEQHDGKLSLSLRRELARKAFERTAHYDATIATYFATGVKQSPVEAPAFILTLPRHKALRYGENPHQKASFFGTPEHFIRHLHGKELSYNNLLDIHGALALMEEFRDYPPTCAILKHTNPCGVATAPTLLEAYQKAFQTDTRSPFGGIVIVNRPLDRETAEAIDQVFTEVILAPVFEEGVLDFLQRKKNRRIIEIVRSVREDVPWEVRSATGGVLVQERDPAFPPAEVLRTSFRVVTTRPPTEAEWNDLDFAWRVVKHVKSNAIVYARNRQTLGIGAGQMSRVDAAEIAIMKGQREGHDFTGSVVASDAFFPFADGLEAAARVGATAVIQPGGSIRDQEVIEAANRANLAMVFTGRRHFKH